MIRRLCFGLVFLLALTSMAHAEMVSVNRDKAKMLAGPGETHTTKWELDVGYPLKVVSRKGDWLKVTDYESDAGWIHKKLVAKTPYMIVKDKKTIIRDKPGEKQAAVATATHGVVLRTIKHKGGWVQVRHESGLTGWIRCDQLWGW